MRAAPLSPLQPFVQAGTGRATTDQRPAGRGPGSALQGARQRHPAAPAARPAPRPGGAGRRTRRSRGDAAASGVQPPCNDWPTAASTPHAVTATGSSTRSPTPAFPPCWTSRSASPRKPPTPTAERSRPTHAAPHRTPTREETFMTLTHDPGTASDTCPRVGERGQKLLQATADNQADGDVSRLDDVVALVSRRWLSRATSRPCR
jgi:hypothetical protein